MIAKNATSQVVVSRMSDADRDVLYRARHDVYATELRQYEARADGLLPDREDLHAVYLVASVAGEMAGFIGITPPDSPRYSVDRYLRREDIPFAFDQHLFEIRALTVLPAYRGRLVAAILMYAAFRWVESHGGNRVLAIGRREVLDMYLRVGLERVGTTFASGAVTYELMTAELGRLGAAVGRFDAQLQRLERNLDWRLDVAFRRPAECYHGGAFFGAIGESFDHLERKDAVISADVLDAWFPPAPAVREALSTHLDWLVRTSPPTHAEGLTREIARARGLEPRHLLVGGGSSDLIFLALRQWLTPSSRVLLLDPTYGEYAHVVEQLVRCRVERVVLSRRDGYRLDPERLVRRLQDGFDLFVWVNPNNPTGLHLARQDVEQVLAQVPAATRVWLDETYVEYAGRDQSLESWAMRSRNVVVCKSMSKVYALSGLRAGYLCGPVPLIDELRPLNPPWAASLPAQVAATLALQDPDYYEDCYQRTHALRRQLADDLRGLGIEEQVPGVGNFILFHLPAGAPPAAAVVQACRAQGLFLRGLGNLGRRFADDALRVAVKDASVNRRMVQILGNVLRGAA